MDILFCLLAAFFGFSLAETGKPLLRLVGGINRCVGRVEVYHQRQWGTVCDDDWDLKDAQVVCRELKCGTALRAYPGAFFGLGTGRIWLYNVNCKGTELSLTECHHPPWGRHDCLHDEDASVVCSAATTFPEDFTPPTESQDKDETEERVTFQATVPPTAATTFLEASTSSAVSQDKDETEEIPTFQATVPRIDQNSVRLVGGQDRCSGRIEIFHGSQWGTVCDDEWDLRDATVACRQLGCGAPLSVYRKAKFGQGTGPIWLDDVHCTGLESSLAECRTKPWGISNCKHMEDAGLVCSDQNSVRLVGGQDRCSGRIEIFHGSQWGTVCDDEWDLRDATVACRQLGCGAPLSVYRKAKFGQGTGPIWLDDVHCTGLESSLAECRTKPWGISNCKHMEDAGLVCSGGKILTLVNGPGRCAGRVEVFYENVWGTVCDDLWGLRNAEVVCRQMGCGSALFAPGNAFFGEGKGPIWLDNVNCTGQESSITDCASASWGVHNCRHGEDAGVVCSDGLSESRPSLSHDPVNSEQRKVPLQRLHSTLASSPRGDISAAPSSPDQTPSQDNRAVEEETLGTFLQTIRSDWMGQTPPSKVETSDKSSSVEEETLGTFLQTIRSDWMGQTPPSKVETSDKSSSVEEETLGTFLQTIRSDWMGQTPPSKVENSDKSSSVEEETLGTFLQTIRSDWMGQTPPSKVETSDKSSSVEEETLGTFLQTIRSDWMGQTPPSKVETSDKSSSVEEETLGTFLQTIRSDWMGQTPPSKVETSDKSSSVEEETLGTFLQTIRSDWMGQTPPSKVENSDKSSSVSSFHQPIPSASEPPLSYVPSGCNKESSTGSQYASLGSSSSPVKQPITGSLETTHLDAPEDSNTYSPTGDTQELPNVWTTQSAVTSTDESPEVIRVRLADGPGRCAGRVEVYHKQQWGTVCDDGWNMPDAQVVCQELGCGLAVSFTKWYGPGSGPIWKDEVSCYGFESSLLQCNSEQWGIHDCEHSEDAGVLCEEFSFHQATPSTSEPALTYAPSAWTKESSTVPQYGSHGNSSPPVQRPITRSTDSSHGDAPEDPNTYSPAVDAQELSKAWTTQPTVVSSNQSPEALWVRLAGGPSHCAGRVEIYHNQQWGSVCNDGWNMLDAQVVCQELGCGLAVSVSQWYGPGSGPIWKDEISCYGFESSLMQCNSEPWGSHDCDHSEDAGVHCEENTSKPEMAGNTTVLTTHEPLASEQVTKSESPSFPEGPSRPSEPQDTCPQHQSKDDACEPKQMPELVKILREMQKDFSSITHPLERNQQQLTSIANSLQDVALSLRRLLEIAPLLTSPRSRDETPQTPTGMPSGTPSQ
ncbi:scavenger receptor cysteine-rich type 1 protein M130-like isoform X3 [Ambystoma mexicanum]|uniref:scavenger receptor cysteine-rich type 1 protein M130-like isoform X3 n=1 Tax=Ambystoma mexicanum TaxID=8296 RepID=UPI0037E99251